MPAPVTDAAVREVFASVSTIGASVCPTCLVTALSAFALSNLHGSIIQTVLETIIDTLSALTEVFAIAKAMHANASLVMKAKVASAHLVPMIVLATADASLFRTFLLELLLLII